MHRCTAWSACFAILLSSLAPSISHAIAAASGTPNAWVEICTVAGSKLIALDSDLHPESPAPGKNAAHVEPCPFCLTHGGALGLPPAIDFVIPVVSSARVLPSLFYQASYPLFAWAVAQPRAPPAFS